MPANMAITVAMPGEAWVNHDDWWTTRHAIVGREVLLPFLNQFPDIQWHGSQVTFSENFAYKAICYMASGGTMLGYSYRYEGTGLAKKQFYRYFKMKYNAHKNEIRIYEIPHKQHERLFTKFRESFR